MPCRRSPAHPSILALPHLQETEPACPCTLQCPAATRLSLAPTPQEAADAPLHALGFTFAKTKPSCTLYVPLHAQEAESLRAQLAAALEATTKLRADYEKKLNTAQVCMGACGVLL